MISTGESRIEWYPDRMPDVPHPAALPIDQLRKNCALRRTRRSGPGGQHRNKVETAVILTHEPTGISAEANERRSQAENLEGALLRLRVNLAIDFRTPLELAADSYTPSELWQGRCLGGRISVNSAHEDFPALLAEALDVLAASADDPKTAGAHLGCTPSQLVKFLKQEPRALASVNRRRAAAGQHELK